MKNIDLHPKLMLAYTEVEDGNIDYRFGDKNDVKDSRKKILKSLKLKPYEIIEGQQIHFRRVLGLNEDNTKMWRGYNVTGVDGFVQDQNDVALMIRVADCVPMVLYDPENHIVSTVHAGWKGAMLGVHLAAVEMMEETYNSNPKQVLVWMGPSAQSCCYKSEEEPEQSEDKLWGKHIKKKGKVWQIDLPGYLTESLKKGGILKKNMTLDDRCTVEDEKLFSFQRSKKEKLPQGRFGVIAKLS